ncbi:hypothetical protein AWV80_15045 [Cupriavidus sp. UYMU48A]|nr:hypothetical protein AWV80_15045 [Cupriavidus sp. UYMU48A]
MHKNLLAPIVIAFSALALPPVALSAGPQTGDPEHDHSHGQASAATPQKPKKAAQSPQKEDRNAAVDAQIAHLRALHERLSRAKTPDERQALMAEQVKVMQESMAMMRSMHAGQDQGDMGSGMGMGQRGMPEHIGMGHDMMVQHMELMQEMMQTMVDRMGMMGTSSGQAMGGGMMSK